MAYDLDGLWAARWLLGRGLAALYLIAFVSALDQFRPLLGERGLLPVPLHVSRVRFAAAPSLFHWRYSDRLLAVVAWTGILLSALLLLGIVDRGPFWLPLAAWLLVWALYLSIVNVGQTFYAFGWESMLLEAGFFAAFLGPGWSRPQAIPVLCLRWMLFRVELGAGLIKLRHDACWRDLTCLYYHHETQPLPNPLSARFHRLPKRAHRFGVLYSHFVQLLVPFGLLAPQPIATAAGLLLVSHQLLLIVSGNYAWLNWLTAVLGASALSDGALRSVLPFAIPADLPPPPAAWPFVLVVLAVATALLSVRPTLNLFSRRQLMNYSYNPLHLVNTYGAFGSVSKERFEVVIEGTGAPGPGPPGEADWRPYELKAKPGDPMRRPRQVAPYHLRLDWLLWFLPFSVTRLGNRVLVSGYDLWFLRLARKLLENDAAVLALFAANPFPGSPPRLVRARYYLYRFADPRERREKGTYWTRTRLGDYLPPVGLADLDGVAGDREAAGIM